MTFRRDIMRRLAVLTTVCAGLGAGAAGAAPIVIHTATADISVDPASLRIDATAPDGQALNLMPALHAPEAAAPVRVGAAWRWSDNEGRILTVSGEDGHVRVQIAAPDGQALSWPLPVASGGDWITPDGEGMALPVDEHHSDAGAVEAKVLVAHANGDRHSSTAFPLGNLVPRQKNLIAGLGSGT